MPLTRAVDTINLALVTVLSARNGSMRTRPRSFLPGVIADVRDEKKTAQRRIAPHRHPEGSLSYAFWTKAWRIPERSRSRRGFFASPRFMDGAKRI